MCTNMPPAHSSRCSRMTVRAEAADTASRSLTKWGVPSRVTTLRPLHTGERGGRE